MPFPPSGRIGGDVPLIGERQGPPEGEYVFWVAAFVKREGQPLDAVGFTQTFNDPNPELREIAAGCLNVATTLKIAGPDAPPPTVIPINWKLVSFTPTPLVEKREQLGQAMKHL